mmetsp:Transcript_37128/g.104757  ORF Transcript_37128/g.104757 Transcript_37128/m.104757 type:complete len:308 (+) Transcript_37128:64-987(+)
MVRIRRNELSKLVWPMEEDKTNHATQLRRDARYVRRARQLTAKQDLLSKVQEQQKIIDDMEKQLQDWYLWYNVQWHNDWRSPAISGAARVRRNVAEHVCDQKITISLDCDVALRRAQRGKRHGAMDVFEQLRDMAMEPPCIVNAGGQVLVEDAPENIEWEGVSLSDLALARRAENEAKIEMVKEDCADLNGPETKEDIQDVEEEVEEPERFGAYWENVPDEIIEEVEELHCLDVPCFGEIHDKQARKIQRNVPGMPKEVAAKAAAKVVLMILKKADRIRVHCCDKEWSEVEEMIDDMISSCIQSFNE